MWKKLVSLNNSSLQWRLITLCVLMSVIPAIIIGSIAVNKANKILSSSTLKEKQAQVDRIAERTDQYLGDSLKSINALARDPLMARMGSPEQTAALQAFQEGNGSFELMFVVDTQGKMKNTYPHATFNGKTDFTDRQWYKDVVAAQSTIMSDTYISAFTKQATVPIVAPIFNQQHNLLGYVGGNLSLSNLNSFIALLNVGKSGQGILIDKKRFYLVDSRDLEKGKKHISLQNKKLEELIQGGRDQAIPLAGTDQVAAFSPIGDTGWSVISLQNYKEAFTSANDLKYLIILIIILAGLAVSLLTFVLVKKIVQPILDLGQWAQKVAEGNLQQHELSYKGRDELVRLIQSFQTMIGNLRNLVQQTTSSAQAVVNASEQLKSTSEQSAQSANQVAVSINEVAAGAEKEAQAVEQTLAVIEDIATGMQQATTKARVVEDISQQTSQAAERGGQQIDTVVRQMDNIKAIVNDLAQDIEKLGQRSQEIGEIADTISAIADQTNLLALNAAIEAARAGEQGRGFAVVAEEVRKLAEQSQEAAHHVAQLISEVQGDTKRAVTVMEQGTKEVELGTEVVNKAGQDFTEINASLQQLVGQIKDIALVIQQGAQGNEKILTSVQYIEEISRDTTSQAQTVSAFTQEQSASMEEVASASQSLSDLAKELEEAVNKFRL